MTNALLFNKIANEIPHSLTIIDLPDTSEKQINCHGFTFDKKSWFETSKVYQMLKTGELVPLNVPNKGCVVLYIDTKLSLPIIYHSGIYIGNGMVISKWANGPVFKHKVFNCPASYGNSIKYYSQK